MLCTRALASRVARHALRHLGRERFIGFEQIQRFLAFAGSGEPGHALSLPGQQARLRVYPAQRASQGACGSTWDLNRAAAS